MNLPRNTPRALLAGALSLFTLSATQGYGQTATATTDPVGYASISCLASSDTLVSIPFAQPTTYAGATSGTIPSNVITYAGSPNFGASGSSAGYKYVAGTQSNTYYALIGPNIAGLANTVSVTNGSTTVNGTGLSVIAVNDELIVNGLAYNVASVAADGTSLMLSRAYTGTTGTGVTAQYDHSPKEGSYYTVTDNGTNALTVNLNGDSLTSVVAGTTVSLIPYWTLGTAFPAGNAYNASTNPTGSFVASTGAQPRNRQTQILLPDLVDPGVDLAPGAPYYFYNGTWTADGSTSANDVYLPPTTYFTVRNSTTGTTFTPSGGVVMNRLSTPLSTQSSGGQDNAVAVPRPAAVALNDLGLITSGAFIASTGDAPRFRKDTLLVYDNTASGTDKSPSAVYYYYNSAWRLSGAPDTTVDYGTTSLPYGTGFKVRKAATTSGTTSFWQNTRNY